MKSRKRILVPLFLLVAIASFSVITAQMQENPNSEIKACHIFPVKNPREGLYPSNIAVPYSTDATLDGCYASCQYCYGRISEGNAQVCIDHYNCGCEQYFDTMDCKGKPFHAEG